MRFIVFSFVFVLLCSFDGNSKVVEWRTETVHDFGDLLQGNPATFDFVFKNITDEPFVIDNVRPTCGCTAPDWEKTPVLPDSTGVIKIEFSAKKRGYFKKKVKVFFSSQRKAEHLYIKGYVE